MANYSQRAAGIFDILADRTISYHPKLATVLGVKECVFVCQFLYWDGKGKLRGDWIYKTQEEITEETGLSRYEQETVRKRLKRRGILEEDLRGIPARLHYRLDFGKLSEAIEKAYPDQDAATPPPSLRHDPEQDWGVPPNKIGGAPESKLGEIPQAIPETTIDYQQEITQESCAACAAPAPPAPAENENGIESAGSAGATALASPDPLREQGQGETDPEALTPDQKRLVSAAGLTAAANAAAGGTPWSVPGAAYEAPAPEALPGWERVLARRRWAGDVRPAAVLALAVRFADAEHADLTPPAAADPSAVKDWAAALERFLLTANPPGAVPTNGDQAAWLDRRLRRATWIMDYIFARREAGAPDYSGFTICRPGSILKIAALAEQALREAQKGSTDDTLPAIDATAPPARGAGPGGARAAGRGGLAGSTHAAPVDPGVFARQREALRRRDAERQAAT